MLQEWKVMTGNDTLNLGERKSIFIIDQSSCDGRPIIQSIICKAFDDKTKNPLVVLVTLDRPFKEYISVGRRLGCDLNLLQIQKKIIVFDLISGGDDCGNNSNRIEEALLGKIASLNREIGQGLLVIIDGLSIVTCLGWSLEKSGRLIIALENLFDTCVIGRVSRECAPKGLIEWLVHRSELSLILEPLKSGISREAHAHLVLLDRKSFVSKEFLFKCTDSACLLSPLSF